MPDENLAAVLHRLQQAAGQSFSPLDFERRLRIQKSIYLLKCFGYPYARRYTFGAYVRGPYSPGLAHDYYALPHGAVETSYAANIPDAYLRSIADAVRRGNDFLEAAATIHIYVKKNPTLEKADVMGYVLGLKPELESHLQEAWTFLGKNGLLRESM